jgi:ABC-2 type transport system permease protein
MTTTLARPTTTLAPVGRPAGRFTGTAALVRLAIRRDRVLVPVWLVVFVLTAYSSAAATVGLYAGEADRRTIAESVNSNPALLALYGPVQDVTSMGQVALFKVTALGAALVALLSIVLVVRHTRGDEEAGRTELVGAGVVGRWAPLASALLVVTGVDVVLAVLTGVSLLGAGLDLVGSLSFGAAWAVTGIAFAAIAGLTAQLAPVARGATGLASAVLAAAYVVRGVADTSADGSLVWVRWLSPVGWAQALRPFAEPRWAVIALSLTFAVTVGAGAFALVDRRDLGAGLLPDRRGSAVAGRGLASGLGLALRLHRGTLIGWSLGFLLLGSAVGSLVANVEDFLDDAALELIRSLGGTESITDAYMATEWAFVGIFVSAYAVQAVLRMRVEESAGRLEPLLGTALTRQRWTGGHLLVAVGGAAWLLLLGGIAAAASTVSATGDADWWGKVLGAAAVQLPAVAVLAGITLLAVGLAPRAASGIGWGALVAFLLLGQVGPLLELPSWVLDLSPYSHTPKLPGGEVGWLALAGLVAVAAAVLGAGLAALRRRDVPA